MQLQHARSGEQAGQTKLLCKEIKFKETSLSKFHWNCKLHEHFEQCFHRLESANYDLKDP